MSHLSAPVGAIVRAWFPESEAILSPGPKLRPCLVIAEDLRNGRAMVLVAYGTSQRTWARGAGELTLDADSYQSLTRNTKFCLRRAVWLPLSSEYFYGQAEMLKDTDLRACVRAVREAKVF